MTIQITNSMKKTVVLYFMDTKGSVQNVVLLPDGRPKDISAEDWACMEKSKKVQKFLAKYEARGLTVSGLEDEPETAKPAKPKRGKKKEAPPVELPELDDIGGPVDA